MRRILKIRWMVALLIVAGAVCFGGLRVVIAVVSK